MQNIKVLHFNHAELDDILEAGERLLWSGVPGYGRKFLEAVGNERKFHIAALAGIVVMWSTLFFIDTEAQFDRTEAIWIYGAATLMFLGVSAFLASERHYVLYNLVYLVTDRRAIIFRRGRNWRLGVRLYVVSCPHSKTYPYSLIESRPYPSLQIGTLLSVDQVQPFGSGLSHPGHSFLRDRITSIVTFDYLPDAEAVLEMIQSNAHSE
ncbi:hypothetical protein [Palleronia caenipelagi]|uniref:Uncharacterized protein n=1 Tax=Palleronia caenipelagi TaxID=2489174 RepID=A0A547PW62_9RHOB|nr:hypothetical protein [Palleronia caenipelagi]TRD18358.1 hypothetical protein FEV53_11930 [Palleronia caenipelagi]